MALGDDINHGFAGIRRIFIIFDQSAAITASWEGPFDDPAFWQKLEAIGEIRALHNLYGPSIIAFGLLDQFSRISAINPDNFQLIKIFLVYLSASFAPSRSWTSAA